MLKSQEPSASKASPIPHGPSFQLGHTNSSGLLATLNADFGVTNPDIAVVNDRDPERWRFPGESPQPVMDEMGFNSQLDMNMDQTFTWEMIGLGLDEPLPPQETIDELCVIYSRCSSQLTDLVQAPDLLRKNPSFATYDTQVSIFGSNEPV